MPAPSSASRIGVERAVMASSSKLEEPNGIVNYGIGETRLRARDLLCFACRVRWGAGRGELRAMFRELLSATSALALVVGLGGSARAACTAVTNPFQNFGTLDCVNVTNQTINGSVSNGSTGTIGSPSSPQPGSLSISNSTINGSVQNSGHIFASGGTPVGINVTGGSVIPNGIINNSNGTIGASNTPRHSIGINVSQSSLDRENT